MHHSSKRCCKVHRAANSEYVRIHGELAILDNRVLWNSKADKIIKLKYIVNCVANAWATFKTLSIFLQMWMGNLQSMIKMWHECMVKLKCECISSIFQANTFSNANASSALSNANTLSGVVN